MSHYKEEGSQETSGTEERKLGLVFLHKPLQVSVMPFLLSGKDLW